MEQQTYQNMRAAWGYHQRKHGSDYNIRVQIPFARIDTDNKARLSTMAIKPVQLGRIIYVYGEAKGLKVLLETRVTFKRTPRNDGR